MELAILISGTVIGGIILLCLLFFVGKKCIKHKCKNIAKNGHPYCTQCEKDAGIYEN